MRSSIDHLIGTILLSMAISGITTFVIAASHSLYDLINHNWGLLWGVGSLSFFVLEFWIWIRDRNRY